MLASNAVLPEERCGVELGIAEGLCAETFSLHSGLSFQLEVVCRCSLAPKLVDDAPGEHWYVLACQYCGREYGPEWVERHHSFLGRSQQQPAANPDYCR